MNLANKNRKCRSLVDAACRLYESESSIPLEVKVHFGGSPQFNKRKQRQIRENLGEPSTHEYPTT